MGNADFHLAQFDRAPALRATILHEDGLTAVDLTGAAVVMRMQRADKTGPVLGGPCSLVGDPAVGVAQYDWQAADTQEPGIYRAEWVVTLASGRVLTWPHDDYARIVIKPRLQ
jgi:hypothetical protein